MHADKITHLRDIMYEQWLIALGLVLVLEGLIPTLAPRAWKKLIKDMASKSDNQLRVIGIILMLCGLSWIFLVK